MREPLVIAAKTANPVAKDEGKLKKITAANQTIHKSVQVITINISFVTTALLLNLLLYLAGLIINCIYEKKKGRIFMERPSLNSKL